MHFRCLVIRKFKIKKIVKFFAKKSKERLDIITSKRHLKSLKGLSKIKTIKYIKIS